MESGVVLTLFAVAYFTHAIIGPNANTLTSIGRTRLIICNNLAVGIPNAILNLELIPEYGYFSAGVATTISYVNFKIPYSAKLYRETKIYSFTTSLVYPGLAAAALMAFIYLATIKFFTVTIPILVAIFVLFMALYAVVIIPPGGVGKKNITLVYSLEERFDIGVSK
jgi:O-antigen/teichoic acid export membrane protein